MGWQLFGDREGDAVGGVDDDLAETRSGADAGFWSSPVGRAARARLRGDRFFQIELDAAEITAYAAAVATARAGRRARRTCDLLGQIEELGWRLEHVSWWRVDATGEPDARVSDSSDHGVRGVYLFHCVPDEAEPSVPGSPDRTRHAPTHRRDVR
jgi:hypothetical protein